MIHYLQKVKKKTKRSLAKLPWPKGFLRAYKYVRFKYKNQRINDSIFIWIPKTAGTSFYESYNKSGHFQLYLKPDDVKSDFFNKGMVTFGHISLVELISKGYISDRFQKNAFKFCIVRNPYDRFVSLFHYLKSQNRIEQDFSYHDFAELVKNELDPVGLYNFKGISQANPQVEWIKGFDDVHILHFEKLNEVLPFISKKLGREQPAFEHENKSTNRRKDFYEELDENVLKFVREFYSEDFERFGYEK